MRSPPPPFFQVTVSRGGTHSSLPRVVEPGKLAHDRLYLSPLLVRDTLANISQRRFDAPISSRLSQVLRPFHKSCVAAPFPV